jgi:hypothetical protein
VIDQNKLASLQEEMIGQTYVLKREPKSYVVIDIDPFKQPDGNWGFCVRYMALYQNKPRKFVRTLDNFLEKFEPQC